MLCIIFLVLYQIDVYTIVVVVVVAKKKTSNKLCVLINKNNKTISFIRA